MLLRAWDAAQWIECLPSLHQVWDSIPGIAFNTQLSVALHTYKFNIWDAKVHGHPQLRSESEVSINHIRPHPKNRKGKEWTSKAKQRKAHKIPTTQSSSHVQHSPWDNFQHIIWKKKKKKNWSCEGQAQDRARAIEMVLHGPKAFYASWTGSWPTLYLCSSFWDTSASCYQHTRHAASYIRY